MSFASLGLSPPLLKAITEQGYNTPTPIQTQAIPAILAGKDVLAAAQTGTGKTAGFTLPILERLSRGERAQANHARALVLVPTRELAAQVGDSITTYGKHLPLRVCVVYGGVKINPQMMQLRKGADVLVATPGRLLDLFQQNAVKFTRLETLILDEADRMLDLGFIDDIRKIISLLPVQRQTLLFSATFSDPIRTLAKSILNTPIEISVSPRNTAAKSVRQWICPVDKKQKAALLTQLIQDKKWQQVLVFTKTKRGADQLSHHLDAAGIKATAIHGDKSQGARTRALADFKKGSVRILVATDVAARGLDIDQLPQVVNFDLPKVTEDYIHRIGRTGRAGASGEAISLVCADEFDQLAAIERLLKKLLPRTLIDGFEPNHNVPESRLDLRPIPPKKPKKPKKRGPPAEGRNPANQKTGKPGTGNKNRKPAKANPRASGKPVAGRRKK